MRAFDERSVALSSAPDSKRGILSKWERESFKAYCPHCQTVQKVVDVGRITQTETSAVYDDCLLACQCPPRQVIVAVRRPTKKIQGELQDAS
jgi:hypothetical protein